MDKENIRFYDADLGIDGTIPQLLDWSYRYDDDYSDEALQYIVEKAEMLGFDARVPKLILAMRRNARQNRLCFEQMQIDYIRDGRISFSETTGYGDLEIRTEGDNVLISITGVDDEGAFTAANAVSAEEFMSGEGEYLEQLIGSTLFYGKQYEEEV